MGFIPVIYMTELVKVGNISDFKENELTSFNVEGIELMGTIIDGQYHVTSRICSHKYFDLTKGHYADGFVTCTLHTSIFNIESGDALNPPATENIEIYQTVIKNDFVYINVA